MRVEKSPQISLFQIQLLSVSAGSSVSTTGVYGPVSKSRGVPSLGGIEKPQTIHRPRNYQIGGTVLSVDYINANEYHLYRLLDSSSSTPSEHGGAAPK